MPDIRTHLWAPARFWALAAVPLLLVSGCRVPDVQRAAELSRFQAELAARQAAYGISAEAPLSMDRCVELALVNNLDYQVRKLQASLQDDQVRLALADGLPRVDFSWLASKRSNKALSNMGGGAPVETEDERGRAATVQGVIPILDWGTTYYAWGMAKDRQQQELLLLERARQTLARDVRSAYVHLAGAQRQERLSRVAVLAAQELLRVAKSLEREELDTRAATAEVEAGLAQAALSWSNLRRGVEQARLNLAQLMSLPPGLMFTIDDTLPRLRPLPAAAEIPALEESALVNRPEMAVQDKQQHLAAIAVRKEIAAFFPHVDGLAGYTWSSQSMLANPSYYRFGLQVSDSLLNGGRNLWSLNAARKTVKVEQQRTLLLSLGILYEVDFRLLLLYRLYDALVAREAVVTAQTETLKQVVSRYVEGLETGTETIRSLAEMYIARLDLDLARTEYLVAWFELDTATLMAAPVGREATSEPPAAPAALPPFTPAAALDTYTKMIEAAPQIDLHQYPELQDLLRKADLSREHP